MSLSVYGKCPEFQTLYAILFCLNFVLFMNLFHKILRRKANCGPPQSQCPTYPLPIPPPPHRPLVLSIYIFLTFADLKMLYMKWILFGVKLYIRFSSFLSLKHVKTTLIVNYQYIMLLAPMYLARNSPLCIHADCFWEKNYISTCPFVLIPICIITCIML